MSQINSVDGHFNCSKTEYRLLTMCQKAWIHLGQNAEDHNFE